MTRGARILRAADVAARLGISVKAVRTRWDRGQLPFFFEHAARVMWEHDLDAYLARCAASTSSNVVPLQTGRSVAR